ncbi:MAG: hypothetical protein EHM21_07980 [Chloroflexi bacterium]|nr:MAG: hypothetical protein EHM21_07980 [Chloroflexota bacterium]
MTKQADLTAYLFEGIMLQRFDAALSADMLRWMESSPRYTDFVDIYRDKIRKKIRVTRDPESVLDVRSELEVACRLLDDRRFTLVYEPYASAKRRGPDFAVTYRANLVFNIEVARLRVEASGSEGTGDALQAEREPESARKEDRIFRILLNKLGQMQSGMGNLLTIHTREELVRTIDLGKLMQTLKTRAEGKDPAFYAATRYPNPAAFYKDFHHLSGILLWASSPEIQLAQLWVNKQSRPGLDERVARLVAQLL